MQGIHKNKPQGLADILLDAGRRIRDMRHAHAHDDLGCACPADIRAGRAYHLPVDRRLFLRLPRGFRQRRVRQLCLYLPVPEAGLHYLRLPAHVYDDARCGLCHLDAHRPSQGAGKAAHGVGAREDAGKPPARDIARPAHTADGHKRFDIHSA